MKSLYIIRHAKSSWGNIDLQDYDRPLNDRGKNDAPDMARRLLNRGTKIDAFVTSPAKRAKKTAEYFTQIFGVKENKIILVDDLYHASENTFYAIVAELDNELKHVALFSHNPGITDFANSLCVGVKTDNMPTCSIFAVSADIKKWKDFRDAEKSFLFFDYPKKNGVK